MTSEAIFTRGPSIADAIEALIQAATTSVDVAVYRLDSARLAGALNAAVRRGLRVRVVLDRGKYAAAPATRALLESHAVPCRLAAGRHGLPSKMHHKFAVLDDRTAITGSYNWTRESEAENWENLVILRGDGAVAPYRREFDALWATAADAGARDEGMG